MERITISLDDELAEAFDALIARRGYSNRSEAVRDLIRSELERNRQQHEESPFCVGALSYVYNHHERDLAERLTRLQHDHHDLGVATIHAHLDHDHCIEATILRGPTETVRRFADAVAAERGVHHGKLNLITVQLHSDHEATRHGHGNAPDHLHFTPAG